MKKVKNALHDLGFSLLIGALAGCALLVVLFLVGTLLNGLQPRLGLIVARGGLFVVAALALFVCAGLLIRPQKGEKVRDSAAWKRRFQIFGLLPVLGTAAVALILMGSVLDYLLYFA